MLRTACVFIHGLTIAIGLLAAPVSAPAKQQASFDLRTYQAIHIAADDPAGYQMARVLRHEVVALYDHDLPIRKGLPEPHHRVILLGRPIVTKMGLIDPDEFEAIKWDGYLIKANPRRIIITGYGPQGTIYGTYGFLKQIGLAHYPWHFGGVLKRYRPIPDANIRTFSMAEKPFFEWRDVLGQYGGGRFGTTLRKYTLGELKWARKLPALKEGGYIGWEHTAGYLAPIQTHRQAHPEFYATRHGATIPASTKTMLVGICACHPTLEAITIDNALAWMKRQPARRLFGITDGDRENWRCPSCTATDPIPDYYTDRNLRWANAVARAIRTPYPDNQVFTLAYLGTVKPPTKTSLEPNAFVLYAPWYWTSRATSAVGFEHPLNLIAMEELIAWTRLFPGQVGVYDYTGPWIYGAAERIKLYARHGIRWVYMNRARGNLLHWVASQLLWDPDLDVEDLIAEFIHAFYGPSANAMQTYYAQRRKTMQQKSLTAFPSPALFQDQAFLDEARRLLRLAAQQAEGTDIRTETRILEGVAKQLYWVLHAEMAMQVEPDRLRSDFELFLQCYERMWRYCDQLNCSAHQRKWHMKAFETSLTRLGLARVTMDSTTQSGQTQALDQARQHMNQYLQNRTPAKATPQTVSKRTREELAFVGPNESQHWQVWAPETHLTLTMKKRSLVGPHGETLTGVGARLPLSHLPLSKRGAMSVHSGHFRLRRQLEPALDARGQRYISLHLRASQAVPVTVYINERPAFRSDFTLIRGEQIIRIDLTHFTPRNRAARKVKAPDDITSIILDIYPQNRFYPHPETQDTELMFLGIKLENVLPSPEHLPYPKKAIWMSHFRPNIRHRLWGGHIPVGRSLSPSHTERFRSSTPHRILSPVVAIVTEPSNHPEQRAAVRYLQRRLRIAYGAKLPVFWQSQPHRPSPFDNAFFLGPVAVLAHDRVSLNDLDDIGNRGFVVRARRGSIAIAGSTWEATQRGISTYLQRHGVGARSQTAPSRPLTKRSPFLHEFYLIEH